MADYSCWIWEVSFLTNLKLLSRKVKKKSNSCCMCFFLRKVTFFFWIRLTEFMLTEEKQFSAQGRKSVLPSFPFQDIMELVDDLIKSGKFFPWCRMPRPFSDMGNVTMRESGSLSLKKDGTHTQLDCRWQKYLYPSTILSDWYKKTSG